MSDSNQLKTHVVSGTRSRGTNMENTRTPKEIFGIEPETSSIAVTYATATPPRQSNNGMDVAVKKIKSLLVFFLLMEHLMMSEKDIVVLILQWKSMKELFDKHFLYGRGINQIEQPHLCSSNYFLRVFSLIYILVYYTLPCWFCVCN